MSFQVKDFTSLLSFMFFHTIGKLIIALAIEEIIAVLPARLGAICPCIAMVAAAAVVLALLTSPPTKPVTSMPESPEKRETNVPLTCIIINSNPKENIVFTDMGEVNFKGGVVSL